MVLSLTTFGCMITLLFLEGVLILRCLCGHMQRAFAWSLALPAGAIGNVLLFLILTLFHIPLNFLTMFGGHVLIITLLWLLSRNLPDERAIPVVRSPHNPWSIKTKILATACAVLLANTFVFGAVHALVLPSISIDVFTNWAMRSQISWNDEAMAFDRTEERGMAKPQYPFLVHALQITANAGQRQWSDRAANAFTWLLTMSSLTAGFLLLQRRKGTLVALGTLTVITQIPLMAIHLSAGYGDIHLVTYGLLCFLALAACTEEHGASWLALSGLMMLGALWSKSEGLYFVFVPWVIALLMLTYRGDLPGTNILRPILIPFLCFLPFLILVIAKGLPLTPHESDGTFGFRLDGLLMLPHALWNGGSMGVLWYVLPLAIPALLWQRVRRPTSAVPLLFIGLLSFLGVLSVYLFTPNVVFLLNSQSFYRQLLLPSVLLIAWCGIFLDLHQYAQGDGTATQ